MGNRVMDYAVIIKKLGSGSFGEVYLAEKRNGGTRVACKTEMRVSKSGKKNSRLLPEYKTYKYLHKRKFGQGIPKIFKYQQCDDYNMMYMELMGPSLEDLFNKCGRKFNVATVVVIARQIIVLLEKLHNNKFIHRDIKPNNFLVDLKTQKIINIMDFGLSKKYVHTGNHLVNTPRKSLTGTVRYASIHVHNNNTPSRRDDLISVGYMLIYFLKGRLPWQGLQKKKLFDVDIICKKKMETKLEDLCKNVPDIFYKYLKYTTELDYYDTPNYGYLKKLFTVKSLDENNLQWLSTR